MRFLVATILAAILTAPAAGAERAMPAAAVQSAHQASLDDLFSDLKRERNEKAARRIAGRIRAQWRDSGSATADLLMGRADKAVESGKYIVALDLLDEVVVLYPDYAEGWNRRATLHFMMENYAKSMSDIARTLALEPRHFGALAGMAGIFKATGRDAMALEAYRRVLDVYPMMRNAQSEMSRIAEELAGEGI